MRNITIVFEKDKGIVPWIIRKLTKSDINHVAIMYDSYDWEDTWVAEASAKGVRAVPLRNRNWKYIFQVKYDSVDHLREAGEYIGNKYDTAGLFGFGYIILMWKLFKIRVKRPWRSAKKQLCSEFVARVLVNNEDIEFDDPEWVTPQQLLELCEQHPELFKKVPCD